ncbi:unnamed protein product [Caenorhabditis bovis]|uniref:Uncharacterized protein n=1 Tax=Caenorhabditis bovis TaxID=2654633 RepID=A0A8S1EVB0_9PELO|nr:unnamed protein product [Caenorhabditis bovis]
MLNEAAAPRDAQLEILRADYQQRIQSLRDDQLLKFSINKELQSNAYCLIHETCAINRAIAFESTWETVARVVAELAPPDFILDKPRFMHYWNRFYELERKLLVEESKRKREICRMNLMLRIIETDADEPSGYIRTATKNCGDLYRRQCPSCGPSQPRAQVKEEVAIVERNGLDEAMGEQPVLCAVQNWRQNSAQSPILENESDSSAGSTLESYQLTPDSGHIVVSPIMSDGNVSRSPSQCSGFSGTGGNERQMNSMFHESLKISEVDSDESRRRHHLECDDDENPKRRRLT